LDPSARVRTSPGHVRLIECPKERCVKTDPTSEALINILIPLWVEEPDTPTAGGSEQREESKACAL
jgi:hypothetical protein